MAQRAGCRRGRPGVRPPPPIPAGRDAAHGRRLLRRPRPRPRRGPFPQQPCSPPRWTESGRDIRHPHRPAGGRRVVQRGSALHQGQRVQDGQVPREWQVQLFQGSSSWGKRRGSVPHVQNLSGRHVPVPDASAGSVRAPCHPSCQSEGGAPARPRRVAARKLTAEQESEVRSLAGTRSLRSLAAQFGVSHETVRAILRADRAQRGRRGSFCLPH